MKLRNGYIPFTEDMIKELKEQSKRTGVGAYKVLKGVKVADRMGISPHRIAGWINNPPASVGKRHYNFILERWKSLPDHGMLEITDDMREKLAAELERTQVSVKTMLMGAGSKADGLTPITVTKIKTGRLMYVKKSHWDFLMSELSNR